MALLRIDPNERRYNNILEIIKLGEELPNYFEVLFDNCRNLFYGVGKPELADELDKMINDNLEIKLGQKIDVILYTYRNLPYVKSYTTHPLNTEMHFHKYEIRRILKDVASWIMRKLPECEQEIRFTLLPKQNI